MSVGAMPMNGTKEDAAEVIRRKQEHLDMSLLPEVRGGNTGLEAVRLPYDAMFEVSDEALDTSVTMAGVELAFPLMFGAMTGGTPLATPFNTCLRGLAARHRVAMCLGSIRAVLCDEGLLSTYGSGAVEALFANIGAEQIGQIEHNHLSRVCERLGVRGLFIHLNGLQEWVQPEGWRHFSVSYDALAHFVDRCDVPVYIKEVGNGIGGKCASRLASLNIAGIETASVGGTSWVKVEARRGGGLSRESIESLSSLGYNLVESLSSSRRALGQRTLIASGGISTPLDIVKALSLGADLVAMAQPLYRWYREDGAEMLARRIDEYLEVSRLIWRSTGARDLKHLHERQGDG